MDDRELLQLLRDDPETGTEALIRTYGKAVHKICSSVLSGRGREITEEAAADTFVRLWRYRDNGCSGCVDFTDDDRTFGSPGFLCKKGSRSIPSHCLRAASSDQEPFFILFRSVILFRSSLPCLARDSSFSNQAQGMLPPDDSRSGML